VSRKKRVAILIFSLGSGGAERVVSILLNSLYREFEFTLFLMNSRIDYRTPKEIKVVYLQSSEPFESGIKKLLKLPLFGWIYRNHLIRGEFDISLSLLNRPNYINVFAKIFGSSVKSVISERGNPSTHYSSSRVGKGLVKWLYPKADLITCNSYGNRLDLIESFGVDGEIKVLQNPIDLSGIELSKGEGKNRFITVGRLDSGKNHKLQIDALSEIDGNWSLQIVGDGVLRGELESYIKQKNLSDRVELLGRQSNPFKYLQQADYFLFSSSHEGFPNVLLEALSVGLPVLSTDCRSGPREILSEDREYSRNIESLEVVEYGVLTPVGDLKEFKRGVELLLQEGDEVKRLRKVSRNRAEEFSLQNQLELWRELFNQL
jgi:N-acetylgalactosamine-N,N'-diacetylbacillosaminyl-diphospho-undecaprenol 4-alpha-N-acetylgalactosaminyltransferase